MSAVDTNESNVYPINTATKNALEYERAFFLHRQNHYAK
jgi:hypothetical protein